jgi:PIN domain nuclease of toxin-antitoxin system
MRLLLDTHALIWWFTGDDALPAKPLAQIQNPDNQIHVSAATAWEIATKVRLGKLTIATALLRNYSSELEIEGFVPLPISDEHALLAGSLENKHGDPFDRMIAAQARIENLTVVSRDQALAELGCDLLW